MGLGRKGERDANTPTERLPPSRGGRTTGLLARCGLAENSQMSQEFMKNVKTEALYAAQSIGIAVLGSEDHLSWQVGDDAALFGYAKLRREGGTEMCYGLDGHGQILFTAATTRNMTMVSSMTAAGTHDSR